MGENASIEVGSDTYLKMDRVLVQGCDNVRWDKILLQPEAEMQVCLSTFRDAKKAIVLSEIGDFTSIASVYEDNLIGIESVGTPNNGHDTDIHFLGTNYYPNIFKQGNIGLNLDYFQPQTISGFGLKFENLNEGIHVYHGGLTITSPSSNSSGVSFSNCHSAVNSRQNSLLAVYGAQLYSCYSGFTDAYSQEEIIQRSFILDTKMPFVKYASENSHTLISDNKTVMSHIDLFGYILPSRAEIQNNHFDSGYLNILLYGYGSGKQKWAIQGNPEIIGFENVGNVYFNGMHNASIFHNKDMYATGSSSYHANIKIAGGGNNKIGYNNLDMYHSHGIVVNSSTKNLLYCNQINSDPSSPSGLEIKGECIGTEIRGNDLMGAGLYNLTYGNPNSAYANTGNQPFKGNIFDNSSPSAPKAAFYGNFSLADVNRYFVSPINTQGNYFFPYTATPSDSWFDNNTFGNDYSCPPGKPGVLDPEKQLTDLFTLKELIDNSTIEKYHPEVEWEAKLKLFELLSEYKSNFNSLPPSLKKNLSSMQNSSFAKFYTFDKTYLKSIDEKTIDMPSNEAVSDDVLSITDKLNQIQWYSIDSITGNVVIKNEQLGEYKDLQKEQKEILHKAEQIRLITHKSKLLSLESLQKLNNSIKSDGSVSSKNLQTVNDIWINMEMNDGTVLESDMEKLKYIAAQCATLGGEGVFRARSLLASISNYEFEYQEYNDDCLPSELSNEWNQNSTSNTINVVLSPNPATDQVSIIAEKPFESESIEIWNKLGELVQKISINPESNFIDFDVSNWNEGIYYLQVKPGNPMYKLTVVKQ